MFGALEPRLQDAWQLEVDHGQRARSTGSTDQGRAQTGTWAGVSRADVAAVIVAALRDDAAIGRTIDFIGAGTGEGAPIASAISAPSWESGQTEVAARLGSTQPARGK
jgi:uncharacterized protein YbjT (DUF2867 family)